MAGTTVAPVPTSLHQEAFQKAPKFFLAKTELEGNPQDKRQFNELEGLAQEVVLDLGHVEPSCLDQQERHA